MHMYGFRVVLKDTFAPGNLDTVINQLVFCGHGDLEQFVDDRDLFIRVVVKSWKSSMCSQLRRTR